MNLAVFPGTFDPLTCGHQNLIERAATIFDQVIVAIAENTTKKPLFDLKTRVALANQVFLGSDNIKVKGFSNLLADFAKQERANIIIRGLRVVSDFEYEFQLSNMNRKLAPEVETFFLTSSEQYAFISSSLVKEVAMHKGDISAFVPDVVAKALGDVKWP